MLIELFLLGQRFLFCWRFLLLFPWRNMRFQSLFAADSPSSFLLFPVSLLDFQLFPFRTLSSPNSSPVESSLSQCSNSSPSPATFSKDLDFPIHGWWSYWISGWYYSSWIILKSYRVLLSYSSFVINPLLYLLTLNESRSKSGFSLNNLHNFFVLSFKIIDRFAISTYISYNSTSMILYLSSVWFW